MLSINERSSCHICACDYLVGWVGMGEKMFQYLVQACVMKVVPPLIPDCVNSNLNCVIARCWKKESLYLNIWRYEDTRRWGYEDMRRWRYEDMRRWGYEDTRRWRYEDIKILQYEDIRVWRYEGMKIWRHEDRGRNWFRTELIMRGPVTRMYKRPESSPHSYQIRRRLKRRSKILAFTKMSKKGGNWVRVLVGSLPHAFKTTLKKNISVG